MKVGLTQAEGRLGELEPLLQAAGFEVLRHPLIQTKALQDIDLEPLMGCPWWFFSSASAVEALQGFESYAASRKLGAVGAATAQTLRKFAAPALTSPDSTAQGLLEAFLSLREPGPVGLLQGNRALPTLSDGLKKAGYEVRTAVVYQTEALAWPKSSPVPTITLVASPSALEGLTQAFAQKTHFVALGATTAQAVAAQGWSCTVAKGVLSEDVLEAIQGLAKTLMAVGGNHAD